MSGPPSVGPLFFCHHGVSCRRSVSVSQCPTMTDTQGGGSPSADVDGLDRLCENALHAVGYELVDLEYRRESVGWVLRVFIDHPADEPVDRSVEPKRITHSDCRRASQQLGAVLDVEDPIVEPYSLEVSSPGVYRPLRKERDFERFVGFQVRVKMRDPIDGRRVFQGELQSVDSGVVTVLQDQRPCALPIAGIAKARLAEEY